LEVKYEKAEKMLNLEEEKKRKDGRTRKSKGWRIYMQMGKGNKDQAYVRGLNVVNRGMGKI
jgi:hypothetical protein